ncbi:retrovirus-related pol polyprotein from transposon TNT 1-94 [Tanacetum coccineum]
MWEAIKRLQQGESLNIQDVKTNLFWEFGQFTSQDGETIDSYYIRFYKMMNEMIRNNLTVAKMQLDEVSYHKLFDILKQYQKEVNELHVEKMAKNTNPLALVATAQTLQDPYYQTSKPYKSYAPTSKASLPTRSHATTRYKGKEIAEKFGSHCKNVDTTPRYNQTGQFGNQRAVNVVGARETVGGSVVQQSWIQCFNCKEFGHYAMECRKQKRVKDSTYHKEKMLLCKQAEKGVQLQAEQSNWLADTDEEIDEQELEAHTVTCKDFRRVQYDTDDNVFANDIQHFDQSESISNTCAVETGDSNVTPDSPDMCDNDIQDDQNDVDFALQNKQTEFERFKAFNDRTVDYDKLERKLNETLGLLAQKEIDIKEGLKVKAYEISVVKEKHDELVKQSLLTKSHYEGLVKEKTKVIMDLKLKEEKDIDKMISMENQIKFLNEIVYKRSQSIQNNSLVSTQMLTLMKESVLTITNRLNFNTNSIKSVYNIFLTQSDPATRLIPDREEILTLAEESRSKLNKDLVKPFDYTKLNSLYEIFKPPAQHYEIQLAQANAIRKKMWRKSFVKTKPNVFKNIDFLPVSKSISKSRQAYNVMTNNINHLNELVNQAWVKHSNDHLYLRHPTAQDMEILVKKCLMPLALKTQNDSLAFIHELKQEMHADLKYVESLEDELDELESDKAEFSNMYDMLLQECVSKDVMCSYLLTSSDLDEITELQCLYLHKVMECDCLAQKLSEQTDFVSKEIYTELLQRFARLEKHSISLEIALQECQEQLKNDTVCKEKASNVFRKEREQYFEIQDLKAQLQDKNIAISELKKLIEKCKGKSVDTKFDKPSVVRQPNAQRIPKPLIVQLILFIVDSGCTKHITGNLSLLCNFVEKYLGTVRFGNDQFAPILGYGDLVQGNITIKRVYYVEGLNHNLFSVGQFCDADLEVAFRKSTCFVRDLQGNDLLTGNRGTDLYTISLQEKTSSTPICLMAKASPTQAWLWHRRLSHLNFDYINLLSKKDVVIGLPKLKYVKDQLCSSCEVSKAKRSSFKSKTVPSSKGRLNLLHMDLCGPMRVASINEKKYILVIVDDYSRYTWTLFLHSKDETPEVLKDKKELSIKLLLLEHLNRTALSKDETELLLRLLERCFRLLNFLYSFGLKQLQSHVRITMLIADIEDDIIDPVMQCTTLPSHSSFSQKKLVSFVTEIHSTTIDFLTPS